VFLVRVSICCTHHVLRNQTQFKLLQVESDNFQTFTARTDALAAALGISIEDLPGRIGISRAMIYAYRSGANPISRKAWGKLREAELRASALMSPQAAVDTLLSAPVGSSAQAISDIRATAEDIARSLINAATNAHIWLADTEALQGDLFRQYGLLSRGQALPESDLEELRDLEREVTRRLAKLQFMRTAAREAIGLLVDPSPR